MNNKKGLQPTEKNSVKLEKVLNLLDKLSIKYQLKGNEDLSIVYSIEFINY